MKYSKQEDRMCSLIQDKALEIAIFTYFIVHTMIYSKEMDQYMFLIIVIEVYYDNFKCLTLNIRYQFYTK